MNLTVILIMKWCFVIDYKKKVDLEDGGALMGYAVANHASFWGRGGVWAWEMAIHAPLKGYTRWSY